MPSLENTLKLMVVFIITHEENPGEKIMLLENKIAIVAGVGPGLGRAIALALASHGADVVLAARTMQTIQTVAEEIQAIGRRALCVLTDVSQADQCKHLVETTITTYGHIDILANNAAATGYEATIDIAKLEDIKRKYQTSFFGAIHMAQCVTPYMKTQGGGAIVFTNAIRMSHAGYIAGAGAKAALMIASQTLAKELGKYHIRVNSVCPGAIHDEKMEAFMKATALQMGITLEEALYAIAANTSLKHLVTPKEIADVVVFLASDLSRCITGEGIYCDAGGYFPIN
jgi:NAD(P)-dependent dehydrogenase (short-subunit alcohol dehydrogenase family)